MAETPGHVDETLPPLAAGDRSGIDATLAAAHDATDGRRPSGSALNRGSSIGRYVVLSGLGAGAMGVVLAAYDPELDRKVALKLLKPRGNDRGAARARLQREAQALAKLSHPNVVAVHDVGVHEDRVFVAMEHVEGETLGAWMEAGAHAWEEVLRVFVQAGQGLAAAHKAGLVHRDFKPDNVMLDREGGVRVMDFGLARTGDQEVELSTPDIPVEDEKAIPEHDSLATRLTRTGALMGTPAYMAPEQFAGATVDARTDQFGFCVSLREALYGERPFAGASSVELCLAVTRGEMKPAPRGVSVPGWVRAAVLRGLASKPEDRWPSMDALLVALGRGQARARMRKVLVGVGIAGVIAASVVGYQRYDLAQRIAGCEGEGESIAEIWNEEARNELREALLATTVSYAPTTAQKVMPWLDAQAEAWRTHRTRACLAADVEGTLDPELQDRALWCLDDRRLELAALVTELSRADETVAQAAVTAAASLSPVSPCVDPATLHALPTPPPLQARPSFADVRAELSRAAALSSAGKYPEALEVLGPALAHAETLDWSPLTAAARRLEGHLLYRSGNYPEGETASERAYMEAAKAGVWEVAANAAADLVANVGYRQARHDEGRTWAGHAEVAATFTNDGLGLREGSRLHNLAVVHRATGAYVEAKALLERAVAIREKALGPEHPNVGLSLNSLALVHYTTGAYVEAKALHERALAILEKALGPEHPDVATTLNNLANVHYTTGAYAEAKALHERALAIKEKTLGPEHPDMATSLNNLATLHYITGAYAEAKALHERALAIKEKTLGPEHPDVATSINNLAILQHVTGANAEAKALFERALAIREKALGPEHPTVATSLGNLAAVHLALHRPAEALVLLERAVALFDAHHGQQENEHEARFALARTLVATGGDPARAVSEARKAANEFREAGASRAKDLADVEAWLAEHGGQK